MVSQADLKSLRILHGALVLGCAFAFIVPVFLLPSTHPSLPVFSGTYEIPGAIALVLLPVSFALFNRSIRSVPAQMGRAQHDALKAALIMHWAVIEAAALINAVFCLLEGGMANYFAGAIAVVVLALRAPTRKRTDQWCMGN